MINQPIQILKLMYLALNKEWEKDKDDLFGLYLSEADPFPDGENKQENEAADDGIRQQDRQRRQDPAQHVEAILILIQLLNVKRNVE